MALRFHPRARVSILVLFLAGNCCQAGNQVISGHVPSATSQIAPLGRLDGTNTLDLVLGLPLQNRPMLTNLLRRLYDPADPAYRHYLTPTEFTQQFGPSSEDYDKVVAFAQSNHLTITRLHSNRLLVDVRGSVADIEKALHIQMLVYSHPTEMRTFYAPDAEPSVGSAIPLLHIGGLDDYYMPRPAKLAAQATPENGSAPDGVSYLGSDFRNAYAPGVTLTGAGQSVGLLEFDGYYTNDITSYETLAGLTNVITNAVVTNVLLDGFLGAPGEHNNEVALDIELTIAMAPGLSRVIVYEAGPQGSADDLLNRMATDNLCHQLSSSWTFTGGDDPVADQVFQEFAAQGQSYFNAAGDTDAYSSSIPFPVDNPYITVVGGTTLSTATNKSWSSETVWNLNNGLGSGGGISSRYPIPAWQQGLNLTNSHGSSSNRNFPDVAIVANQIWVIHDNGEGSSLVGTSCAAPLWAAFTALANQQGADYGQPPAGFLNPAIYAIGQGTNYAACFHDITNGNNTSGSSPGQFYAVAGYDLCTGWGTPTGQPLLNALEPPDNMVIGPHTGFAAHGLPGGPLNPTTETFSVTNHGLTALTWAAGTASPWLNVSPTNGTLLSNSPAAQVAVTLNSAAFALPTGTYSADVWFTNQTTGIVQSRHFTLQLSQSLVQNGGFETGDFTDWTLNGSVSLNYVSGGSPIASHSGDFAAALGQGLSLGYLSQTLTTASGQAYLLSFWLENPRSVTPNQFLVNWNTSTSPTNTLFNQTNMNASGWTNLQFIVVAAGSNSTLQFGFRNDEYFFGLDDVTVTPIPPPSPALVGGNGGSFSFSWAALPGLMYQVQYKGNLNQTNWQNLGSALVATNASFFISDPVNPATNRFYRIVVFP